MSSSSGWLELPLGSVNGSVMLRCLTHPQMNRGLLKQVHYTLAFPQGSAQNPSSSLLLYEKAVPTADFPDWAAIDSWVGEVRSQTL